MRSAGEDYEKNVMWLSIAGKPNFQVSDMGDVKAPSGRLLRQHIHRRPGRLPGLRVRIGGKRYMVRRLVLENFAGKPLHGQYWITDINGDPFDNRYDNLVHARKPRKKKRRRYVQRVDHCRMGHELTGDNVELWGKHNRICIKCRDDGQAPSYEGDYYRSTFRA